MIRKRILISIICMLLLASGVLSSCDLFGGRGSSDASNRESNHGTIISEEEAKEIVLSRVPGATDKEFKRFESEEDDGHLIYEGELVYKGIEYEFEIEACNGNILEWRIDN